MKMEPDHENGAIFKLQPNENIIFSCSHCYCTTFVLVSYSLDTQVMLILILIGMPYSKKAVFNFEKVLNPQNHSSSGSLDPSSTPISSSQISD